MLSRAVLSGLRATPTLSVTPPTSLVIARYKSDLVLYSNKNGVTVMTMNNPKKLNGWTEPMILAVRDAFHKAANDKDTKVAILTGKGQFT